MLRQSLARSALRSSRQGAKTATKTFATSSRRQAEVELTIGKAHGDEETDKEKMLMSCCRWQEGVN
jgi:hypothetical protein